VGSVEGRLTKLERESEGLFQTLTLENGTKVKYAPEEVLDAISAAIHGQEHRLLAFVRRKGTRQGLAGLINALEDSGARVEEEGEDGA
jgi:hypothetical protein